MNFGTIALLICGILVMCEGYEPITNYMNHPLYPCVQCLCHARSGCWRIENCARYSINKAYWQKAGSLVVSTGDDPSSDRSYSRCMVDENCIVGTIIKYTERFGDKDCNCDGKFDCKDRAAIHMFGAKCEHPTYGDTYARQFNECASRIGVMEMLKNEGDESCTAPEVEVF